LQGESQHKVKKKQYSRTNKNHYEVQIARHTDVQEKIRAIEADIHDLLKPLDIAEPTAAPAKHKELLNRITVAQDESTYFDFTRFVYSRPTDPAMKVHLPSEADIS